MSPLLRGFLTFAWSLWVALRWRRKALSTALLTAYQLQDLGRRFPPNYLHESWADYLYWDTELER